MLSKVRVSRGPTYQVLGPNPHQLTDLTQPNKKYITCLGFPPTITTPHRCKVSILWRPSCPTFTQQYLYNASTHPHQTHHITYSSANEYNYNKNSQIFVDHMIHDIIIYMDTPTDDNHMHQLLARIVLSAMMYNSDT